jgi:hypothetical protein
MILISAQPDTLFFHWQVELYMYQFSKHSIPNCYAVFGYIDKPSPKALALSEKYPGLIHFYKDERTSDQKIYVPSIRPHILKKFFQEFPELGKEVFYHDSDIFLVSLPDFPSLLQDEFGYVSDTISYIGYNYLKDVSNRYKKKYPDLPDNDLIHKMVELFDMEESLIQQNELHSGGAQYLLKNIDSTFWVEVENKCNALYKLFKEYEKKYPIDHHIQSWATDMWCVLWTYWKQGKQTRVHKTLDFSWATSGIREYYEKNIFHLAGITSELEKTHFYKGAYAYKDVISECRRNPSMFDYVSPTNATYEYIQVLKEYVQQSPLNPVDRFFLKTTKHYGNVYLKQPTMYFDRELWKSQDGEYIIFFNGTCWVLTASKYECEISKTCGGFASGYGDDPSQCSW